MATIQAVLLYPILSLVSLFVFRRPLLGPITPKGINGFPALPNPKPIVGDLFLITRGVEKTEGIFPLHR